MPMPRHLAARDEGSSAVEYGLMTAAVAAVIVGVVFGLGRAVSAELSRTCSAISSAGSLAMDPGCDGTPRVVDPPADTGTDTAPADPGGAIPAGP